MPNKTLIDIAQAEQLQMLAQLRRARYGYLLSLHILLLCAEGHSPTEIAEFLFCSRSSVYRAVEAYRKSKLGFYFDEDGRIHPPCRSTILMPWVKRSLLALVKVAPTAYGWCRTRWSCAALSAQLKLNVGLEASAETIRRWLHELGYEWKRAKLGAKDDDPDRVGKLAKIRSIFDHLSAKQVLLFIDELDINLLAKVGYQWSAKAQQVEIMTPGKNEKKYLAGALDLATGKILHCLWWRKTSGLFIDLLKIIDESYSTSKYSKIYIVADNYKIHKAKAVEQWLAAHPRFEILFQPTYCPRSNPIERAYWEVHDKCTRNHKRKRLRDLVEDVRRHFRVNGPWQYKLSEIYYEPEVTAAVEKLAVDAKLKAA